MTDTPWKDNNRVGRARASGWSAWLVPVVVILAIAALVLPKWLRLGATPAKFPELFVPLDPVPIRISQDLTPSDVVPAEPGSLSGCSLLLITLDTTRADRIGCYGNPDIATPTLDRLAREGVLLSRVMAVAPTTLPSHSTMLTGLYPLHHGARYNGLFRLKDETVTLAEVLSQKGYATGAFVSAWVLASRFGTSAGYDDFDEPRVTPKSEEAEDAGDDLDPDELHRSAGETNALAIPWLRAHSGGRFFLWVHYYDPHRPYSPPSPYAERYTHPYDAEVAYTDSEVGKLLAVLDEVGRSEDTLVVVAGDHGDSIGQHREWTHSFMLYESTQHVPLIMRCGRRLGPGVRVDREASHVDIMPTVLSMLGVDCPPNMDGLDLTQPATGPRRTFAETNGIEAGLASLRAVREGSIKYIHGPTLKHNELFDLSKDPMEENNLYEPDSEVVIRMQQYLKEFFGEELDTGAAATETLTPEELKQLGALGYVGGMTIATGPLPDPREMAEVVGRVNIAATLPLEQRTTVLEEAVSSHPEYAMAHLQLAEAYKDAGDLDRAGQVLVECKKVAPESPAILLTLAEIRTRQKDYSAAEECYRGVLDISPEHMEALSELGILLALRGESDQAAEKLTQAFRLDPRRKQVRANLLQVLLNHEQTDRAIELLDEALRADPDLDGVRAELFAILKKTGRFTEAVAMLRRTFEARPQKLDVANNLAALLAVAPDAEVHDAEQAVSIAEWLCSQSGYKNARHLYTLSMAYWADGQLDEAIRVGELAERVALDRGESQLANAIRARVGSFKNAKNNETAPATEPQ